MGIRSLSAASISTGIKRSKFWDQSAVITGTYESISTVYLSSANAATEDFTNIPNTFMHLELRYSAASDRTNNFLDDINVRFGNGSIDTGANYNYRTGGVEGNGGGLFATSVTGSTVMQSGLCVGGSQSANHQNGIGIFYIENYNNTNIYKTLHGSMGFTTNSGSLTNRYGLFTGSWQSTNAITHIRLELANSNWLRYSHFALYGIRES